MSQMYAVKTASAFFGYRLCQEEVEEGQRGSAG